ncbi:MAG: bifunctional precorrin-2 dehydrogenase/sirohydrochlorin ferrochelatase [Phycisphaeraceae bacterium]|nr:bifunctional precorrin-2 dehydrogenase/sirohydrochlorin ferrochelatase [Phycisphaeraceae bacterium]
MKGLNRTYLPITYDITGKTILILGGDASAFKKIQILSRYTDRFFVVARDVCEGIKVALIPYAEKSIEASDLDGFQILYSCTNDRDLNLQIVQWGHERGMLVNIHDDPELCDFVSPAVYKDKNITVAVSTNGEDSLQAISIRNKLKQFLETEDGIP